MRYGCIIFDDYSAEAWASVAGGDPVRIKGTHELPSDVLWVTNLEWKQMRERGLEGHPRFRADNFLRVRLYSIATDLGLDSDGDVIRRVRALSEIMHHVCTLASTIFGVTEFGMALAKSLRKAILSESDLESYGSTHVDYALSNAYQPFQKCETMPPKGHKTYTFRIPRVEYAKYILGFGIPDGKWKKVILPQDPKRYLEEFWFDKPIMCKIIVRKMNDEKAAQVMPFGFGAFNQRSWATGHEVLHLMKFGEVEVLNMLEGERYRSLKLTTPPLDDGMSKMIYSMGLLAEATWKSLASPKTPRGVWYTSWDRLNMSKIAYEIAERGYVVRSYGSGAITVTLHPSNYQDFLKFSIQELGLSPPFNFINHMAAS